VDDATPNEGGTINYTVVALNNGPDTATGVEVTDLLPAGVTFQSSTTTQGTYTSGTGVWALGTIANAASDTLTITATVDAGTGGTTIVNTATLTATDQADTNPANDSDSADIMVPLDAETQITNVAASDQWPAWSPDGSQIGFDSDRTGNRDLWLVPAGGGTPTQLTTSIEDDRHPDWSPDASKIVFDAVVGGGNPDLYVIPSTGGTPVLLASDPTGNDRFPAWSPDSTQIAFSKSGDIYVIPATGGTPLQITTHPANDNHPTWSPDGTQIAFQSNRIFGNNNIWTIPAIGGTATQITTDPANEGAPDWSPDGTQIAFQSNRSGNNDIWTIPAIGGTATQITTDPGSDLQADWAPNGNQITFARDGNIWIVSFPGVDLAITKAVDDAMPNEGVSINYTVVAVNNGPNTATGVEVTDLLPAGVTFQSSTTTQGTYTSGTGVWALGTIANAASDTLTITATVDAGTGGTTIVNTAAATAVDQSDGNPFNDSGSASIMVQPVVGAAEGALTPTVYALDLARPNPFREKTTIQFGIPVEGMAIISIWDVSGRLVRTLVRSEMAPGRYQPVWDGRDDAGRFVSAGIYFVRLESGSFLATRKVLRLR
jgi:uncharacterized repeat protein (TIGR01451 family)